MLVVLNLLNMIGPLPLEDPSAFPEGKGALAIWRWLRFISTQNEFFLWMYRMIIVWIALVIFLCTIITLRFAAWAKRLRRPYTVGFLHPNCHKKGGGERVLWLAVRSLLEKDSALQVVVYCSPAAAANADAMYDSLDSDLGICLRPVFSPRITLVPVRFTSYIDSNFPFCTILFQSLAGIPLSIHCMISRLPSLFIDTRGCPLSSIAPFFLGCSCPAIRIFPLPCTCTVRMIISPPMHCVDFGVIMYRCNRFQPLPLQQLLSHTTATALTILAPTQFFSPRANSLACRHDGCLCSLSHNQRRHGQIGIIRRCCP